jgi:HAD superfamily hydrolase (TIGR01549 family)
MPATAILDIDGTLVDTNYQHALAWYRAFRQHDIVLPIYSIHRHVGMGGDQIVPALAGEETERELGEAIRSAEKALFLSMIEEVECFEGARQLLRTLKERGHSLVLASSARQKEVDHYLELLDARGLADAWTTSADVESTKPKPDLVLAAMEKVKTDQAVMVGDSTWDAIAAKEAGVQTIAILTGGFSERDLQDAGACCVFESVNELQRHLDETPLVSDRLTSPPGASPRRPDL